MSKAFDILTFDSIPAVEDAVESGISITNKKDIRAFVEKQVEAGKAIKEALYFIDEAIDHILDPWSERY